MSIHPRHAARIYGGVKVFEFRRRVVRCVPGDKILIYETSPVSKVTGEVFVEKVVISDAATLCALEGDKSERAAVTNYLHGGDNCTAIGLRSARMFPTPVLLAELGIARPPQSYLFMER